MAVLNRHVDLIPEGAIPITRPSRWGNTAWFGIAGADLRTKIEAYRADLIARIEDGRLPLALLAALHGRDLVCVCHPKPCHGHVLEAFAAWAHAVLNTSERPPYPELRDMTALAALFLAEDAQDATPAPR